MPASESENGGCCGLSAVDDARRVAERLEIPYYVMNFKREFKENVMDYFVAEYQKGRTPNPVLPVTVMLSGNPCCAAVLRSERIILPPGIMPE